MTKDEQWRKIEDDRAEIRCLMSSLSASTSSIGDWKIIKIYEARLKSEEDPYDFDDLTAKRQAARDRINELQTEIAELEKTETED